MIALADFGGKVNGKPITLVYADHQNKADIAASRAREWFDRDGVDMVIGGTNSDMIGTVVYSNFATNLPFAAAFAVIPVAIMGAYLLIARRLGAFDAL